MPASIINIHWDPNNSVWVGQSAPSVSKSAGVKFNVGAVPSGNPGVLVCLNNTNVFGVSSFSFTAAGDYPETVTGAVGVSSTYHLQPANTTCTVGRLNDDTDPYTIDVTASTDADEQHHKTHAAGHHRK